MAAAVQMERAVAVMVEVMVAVVMAEARRVAGTVVATVVAVRGAVKGATGMEEGAMVAEAMVGGKVGVEKAVKVVEVGKAEVATVAAVRVKVMVAAVRVKVMVAEAMAVGKVEDAMVDEMVGVAKAE